MSDRPTYTLLGTMDPTGITRGTFLDADYVGRNMLAGLAQVPRGLMSLAGAGETANRMGEYVNNALGTSDAQWNVEPGAYAAQNIGAAFVGIPGRALNAVGQAVPMLARIAQQYPRATRVVEALTPVTMPYSPGNIALNAVGGAVVGAGLQELDEALRSTPGAVPLDDGIVPASPAVQQDAQVQSIPLDEAVIPAQQQAAPIALDPPLQGAADGNAPIPLDEGIVQSTGDRIANMLPYALLGGGALYGARAAYRQASQRMQNNAALDGTIVSPGAASDPTISQSLTSDTIPGRIADAATEVERRVLDEGALLHRIIRQAEATNQVSQPQAESLRAALDIGSGFVPRGEQSASVLATGVLPSGHRVGRPMTQFADEFSRLAPDVQARVQEHAAALNELANRRRAAEQWFATRDTQYLSRERDPATGRHLYADVELTDQQGNIRRVRMEEPARVGVWDRSYQDLEAIVARGTADPVLQAYTRELSDRASRWRSALVREGYLSQFEANRMARANPHYLPTLDVETGEATRHFSVRPIYDRSQPMRAQDLVQSWQDYEQHAVRVLQHNRAKRDVARFLEAVQQTLPQDQRIVGRVLPGDTQTSAPDSFSFRENGQRLELEVFAPGIAPVMRNEPKFVIPILNGTRKGMQFFTTGPGAAIMGAPFAPVSAAYNTFSTLATRPAHLDAGYLDRYMKRLTGGRAGFRMDPTFVAQALYAPMADMASIAAREISRRTQGTAMQPLASYLSRAYERSTHAMMQRFGATNSGIASTADFGGNLSTNVGQVSPMYNATRGLSMGVPKTAEDFARYAAQYGTSAVPASAVNGWHIFREIIDVVSNAPQSALWRQNEQLVQQQAANAGLPARRGLEGLARRVRRAGADPSIAGSSSAVTGLLSAIPYGNVALQSAGVYINAMRENPMGTITAVVAGTLVPAIAAVYLAMQGDEQDMANGEQPSRVYNLMLGSTNGRAQGIDIHLPGLPREAAFRFIPDPTMAPLSNAMVSTVAALFGANDIRYFYSQDNEQNRTILRRLLEDHTGRVMLESVQRAGAGISPPPLIDMAARLHGVDIREALNLVDARVGDLRRRTAPGFEQGAFAGDPVNTTVRHVLESLAGSAGVAAVEHIRLMGTLARMDVPTDQQLAAASRLQNQRAIDRLPLVRPLFPERLRVDAFDAAAGYVRDAENKMNEVFTNMGDVNYPGTIGSGDVRRVPQFGPGRVRPPDDIVPVLQQVAGLYSSMRTMRDQRTAASQEITSARGLGPDGPTAGQGALLTDASRMRTFENQQRAAVREINGQIAARIIMLEEQLSRRYNVRIRLDELDPTRGLNQFAPLTP